MAKYEEKKSLDRRAFLTAAGVGAGAVGAATLTTKSVQAATTKEVSDGDGYRRTSHVNKYTETTRF